MSYHVNYVKDPNITNMIAVMVTMTFYVGWFSILLC